MVLSMLIKLINGTKKTYSFLHLKSLKNKPNFQRIKNQKILPSMEISFIDQVKSKT